MPIPVLMLAAGSSSRLGRAKQLVIVDGEPLVRRTARIAIEAGFAPARVVLGAEFDACSSALAGLPVTILENRSWQKGMSTSLRLGVDALDPASEAVLLLVCDQPRLERASLEQLGGLYRSSGAAISAARYSGRLGVPAIFSRALFAELATVSGDRGARDVLQAHRQQAAELDLPEAAFDVDTPDDLARL